MKRISERSAAMVAWKSAKSGVNEDFHGWRVVRLPHVVLVMLRQHAWLFQKKRPGEIHRFVIAYPRPQHVRAFQKAARGVESSGPADAFPGGVGTIMLRLWKTTANVDLGYAQSHFRTSGSHPLPRSLATRYGGWGKHALEHIVRLLVENGHTLRIRRDKVYRHHTGRGKSRFHKELIDAAEAKGCRVARHKAFFLVKPQKAERAKEASNYG